MKGVPGVWNISSLEALCTPVQEAIDAASDQTEVSKTNPSPKLITVSSPKILSNTASSVGRSPHPHEATGGAFIRCWSTPVDGFHGLLFTQGLLPLLFLENAASLLGTAAAVTIPGCHWHCFSHRRGVLHRYR